MAAMTARPAVPGTVHCAVCLAGYEPTPAQAAVLAGLGPIADWQRLVVRYATETGWYQCTDGLLLCTEHRNHGNRPVPPPA